MMSHLLGLNTANWGATSKVWQFQEFYTSLHKYDKVTA